jgi:SH3 domain-containing YSC84-like protein 1
MINRLATSVAAVLVLLIQLSSAHAREDNMVKRLIHATSILHMFADHGGGIPHRVLENAKGVAILDVDRGGFLIDGSGGTGILVMHTSEGEWSAPSAISTSHVGFGFQAGVERERIVLILNDDEAVSAFTDERNDKAMIGTDITIAAGPDHESAEYLTISPADIYAYRMTSGGFMGASVAVKVISTDVDVNYQFYGKRMSPAEIVSKHNPQPEEARELYEALNETERSREIADNKEMVDNGNEVVAVSEPPRLSKRYYYGSPSWEAQGGDLNSNFPRDMYQGTGPVMEQDIVHHAPSTYESRPYPNSNVVH